MTILAVLSRVPYPLEKGDKLRAYNILKNLAKNNKIILFCLNDSHTHPDAIKNLSEFCEEVHIHKISLFTIIWGLIYAFFKGLPMQVGYFYTCSAKKKLLTLIQDTKPQHIFCQLLRVAEYVKDINIEKTIDYQDVFSKGMKRRAKVASFFLRPLFLFEYNRLHNYENRIFDYFNHKIIISEPDRDLIPHHKKHEIHIILNGIDVNYFQPKPTQKKFDLVFTGNMSYMPNILATEMLAKKILPLIHKTNSDINLLLAGAKPSVKVKALKTDKVIVSGWLNDIRDAYNSSLIFVAPMMIGTGLQNKLLEAMAMGLPCITTSMANNALKAKPDEEIIICNNAQEYAEAIFKLLENKNFYNKIAKAGQSYIVENFKWDIQVNQIEKIINSLV